MKLVFLHGAPAVGKLTVAKALLRLIPGRLFDNHGGMDLALTVFDFGVPGFWELVHSARLAVLEAAASHDIPLVVATYCYSEPGIVRRSGSLKPSSRGTGARCYLSICIAPETRTFGG